MKIMMNAINDSLQQLLYIFIYINFNSLNYFTN